ncbi:glutamyl-tRNA synthetase [Tepidamorphus gemmatus]|uniref:Glutamate--tRNA ligase n=1 Tax=Tepidamorphus gemmatus TaxID=747076 RepID=A0A4R3MJ31_9HYPH|nr:glutamate--tRNA ligase [Tepidamorphus gemmatus]TCT11745.1 glutamyl-tRNA synthetase [Tepidamorphus gemmatus]
MHPTVRFAPSPTGYLHIGNARTALINRLFALQHGGRFILRLDDTDTARSRAAFAEAIVEDLGWLGIAPDLTVRQSDRAALYEAAAARLKRDGRLYPCWETAEELDRKRRRQRARGLPPVYDRAALKLTDAARAALEAEGRRPHWRFLLEDRAVVWDDLCRGPQHHPAAALSDPVLIREDGTCLYTFTSVVDDADLGITHVIRGEDHVTNTAVQIQIFEALGHAPPAFAHHNLLVAAGGEELSKRKGTLSLRALREAGYEPMAVASLAVLIGSAEALEAVASLEELAGRLDLARLSRAPSRFDIGDLAALNRKLVAAMAYEDVAERLSSLGVGGGAAFWQAVRGNLDVVADAVGWWNRIVGPVAPVIAPDDRPLLAEAARLLPDEPWDETTFGTWVAAVKAATGKSGRALFAPLRQALTGLDHGPELKLLLPLIGREEAIRRLGGTS